MSSFSFESIGEKHFLLRKLKNEHKDTSKFNLILALDAVKKTANPVLEWALNQLIIEKNCHDAINSFIKLLCSCSLIQYLTSINVIGDIELVVDNSWNFTIKILGKSTKPFDTLSFSVAPDRNRISYYEANSIELALKNSSTAKLVYLKEIGFDDVRCYNLSEIISCKHKQNLFFLQIFSLIYFDYDQLCQFYVPDAREFVIDPVKNLPEKLGSLEYYYKSTGSTKKELEKCVEFFYHQIDAYLEKGLKDKKIKTEISFSPINWSQEKKCFYFEIKSFTKQFKPIDDILCQIEDREVYFRFEFELNKQTIKFLHNCLLNGRNSEKIIDLSNFSIIDKFEMYLVHMEIINEYH